MIQTNKKTSFRWTICALLFAATTVNYLDRQVLSLTWKDFIAPEFHWTNADYGNIAAVFSIIYAIANLLSGRFIDWMGTRKGYLWAIGVWSAGACAHALCGIATQWSLDLHGTGEMIKATGTVATMVATVSTYFFIAARVILGVGEAGNFPAAVKVTAEYFPMKDRAYATSIFNAGATVGALAAPLCIPSLAHYFKTIGWGNGWEMAFILVGALGFVWMGVWMFVYKKPEESKHVNEAELAYINQDTAVAKTANAEHPKDKVPLSKIFSFRQTWAIFLAKLVTDGVWWFFLFWIPAYVSDIHNLPSHHPVAMMLVFVIYAITLLSIFGGKLPTIIVNRTGQNAYDARLKAMLVFAVIPLLVLVSHPLGAISYWFPIVIIGLAGAAHQSWSANLFSVCSDLFPKRMLGTITGINGLAGGISSFAINKFSGHFLDYADASKLQFMGFEGKDSGYFVILCYCAVAYIVGWAILKAFVPKYNPIENETV